MAIYYFSSSIGNDSYDGLYPDTSQGGNHGPWKDFWNKKAGANALSPGDICYFKAGDIWYGQGAVNVDSDGTSGSPIVLDRYGSGNNPTFCVASPTTGWTNSSGPVYYKSGLFQSANTVGVDGTSALGHWTGALASLPAGAFTYNSGNLYIRLADGSNPSGHTIYVPSTWDWYEGAGRGHIRGSDSRGKFVHIKNLKVMYANGMGMSFNNPDSRFYGCEAVGCGFDGISFMAWGPIGQIPLRCRAYDCTVSYCNAAGNGFGQAYTCYGAYCWFINCVAHHNFKEGFDFLNYPGAQSDVAYGGMVYCTSYQNNQDVDQDGFGGSGIYIDGGHDILIYGCQAYNSGIGNDTGVYGRWSNNISAAAEYTTTSIYNIHIVNNLMYNSSGYNLSITKATGTNLPVGCTIVNNTIVRGPGHPTTSYGACMLGEFGTSTRSIIKNNIFYRTAAGTAGTKYPLVWTGSNYSVTKVDMDYNCYYDATSGSIVASDTESTTYDLAGWITKNGGGDSHSFFDNPDLVDSTLTAVDAHLVLSPASPCINAGTPTAPWTPPQWVADAGVLANNGAVVGTARMDESSDSGVMDIGFHYYSPTPSGTLTSTNVQPATLFIGSTNTVTASFTTATAWPADGTLVITFPTTLGGGFTFDSGGTSAAAFTSGGSGSLTMTRSGAVVTLTRSGGSEIAASTAVTLTITYVQNPPLTGTTGAYQLKTTTSAGTTIDIDVNVSADQIIEPVSTYKAITISGVTLSNVVFS